MVKPNFFIVGAPKCGTTAMNDYLAQHPDIFMAPKELHYFGSDLPVRDRLTVEQYLRYFLGVKGQHVIGDASVWYLYSAVAATEIKKFSPDAKILVMLRNPVDMIYSLHSQHLIDANEVVSDFSKAVDLDEERRQGKRLPKSLDYFVLPPYKDSALFFRQVRRYIEVFGRQNVMIILYDDFIKETRKTILDAFLFLGVSAEVYPDLRVVNPNKQIRMLVLHRALKYPNQRFKKMMRALLPIKKVRHGLMENISNMNIRVKKRKAMDSGLRSKLVSYFAQDVSELGSLINRDLSEWLM